jgi:proteasome lid subunit RPN8/RPN11
MQTMTGGVVVTVFPDGGERYLSERFWNDPPPEADAPTPLHVAPAALARIRTDAAAAYPEECCGALLGPAAGQVDTALSLENVASAGRRRRFVVSPEAYRTAEVEAERTGHRLLGFYHSHPDHPAEPSAFDLEHAWPNLSYVIVSVRRGQVDGVRSWRLRNDRSRFDEERLQ